jgi:hypothetical protein
VQWKIKTEEDRQAASLQEKISTKEDMQTTSLHWRIVRYSRGKQVSSSIEYRVAQVEAQYRGKQVSSSLQ